MGNNKSCVVILDNKVLDISKFLDKHPGGGCIDKFNNKDISQIYHHYHKKKETYDLAMTMIKKEKKEKN
jgi:cytochrome b involved in lipid metabolism